MKLHLSTQLRAALMAGFTALAAFSAGQAQANQLYWNGGDGNFIYPVWTDTWGSDNHDFAPGSEVYFQGDGGTIDAIDNPEVGTMEVNGNYSFISADHLTVYGALRVGDGKTGTFDAIPDLQGGDGSIEVNYDATLDLTPIAVNQDFLDTVSHKVADYSAGTVKLQGTAATETLTNHITFRNNVLVDGGLSLNGAESDGYIAIAGEEWDERTFTLTDNLQLEGNAKFLVDGGILDAQGGIVLGAEEGGSGGKLEMTGGKLSTAGITLLGGNENSIEITGGEFTVTSDNAFSSAGEGDDQTTVSISNATLVAEYNDWTLNHGATLTDVTVVHYDWSKVTIGAEGLETIISGTLTNKNEDVELVLLGNITMKEGAVLVGNVNVLGAVLEGNVNVLNTGSISFEGAIENGGEVNTKGALTLAAGANVFTSVTAEALKLTAEEATTLYVTGGLDVGEIILGNLNSTVCVDTLVNGDIVFKADADILAEGAYTLLTLGSPAGIAMFALTMGGELDGITMQVGEQTFALGSGPTKVTGTEGLMLQLVLSEDAKSVQAIVIPEPATATLSLLALAALAARRKRK